MKPIAALLLLVALSVGCSKDHVNPDTVGLTGRWEIHKSIGGIIGSITYPAGNGKILQFNADGTYKRESPGSATETGTYTLAETSTPGIWKLTMSGVGVNGRNIQFDDSGDLIFIKEQTCCDYPDIYYKKLN